MNADRREPPSYRKQSRIETQVIAAMDGLRDEIWPLDDMELHWRGRLVDQHELRCQQAALMKLREESASFAQEGRTVESVAYETHSRRRGFAGRGPELPSWDDAQLNLEVVEAVECRLDFMDGRFPEPGLRALPARLGEQLRPARLAAEFKLHCYQLEADWASLICGQFIESFNISFATALMRLYAHFHGLVYVWRGFRMDQSPACSMRIPDDPTEEQAATCLAEANPILCEAVEWKRQQVPREQ